ncbi:hypothetical protein Dda_5508 [Drechslerella dactyloides]|uniref:Zinc finger C2H2 LYAR-type domain-containing protein n=1 Tax=Drechslerella dactyloides TaxID=74499 RepID=A0AAD6IXM7_DREDA|nr:hypothetical protein Dda_5508 [Drechslerella dactyloides]
MPPLQSSIYQACNETLAKKKLDQHRGRCRQAVFTCLDCNNTFPGTSYREHTSCISEAQKYERTVYRGEKKKGKGKQNGGPTVNGATEATAVAEPAAISDDKAEEVAPVIVEESTPEEVKEEVKEKKEKKKDKKDKKEKKEKKDKKDKKSKGDASGEDVVMEDAPAVADAAVEEPTTNGDEQEGKKHKKDKKSKKDKKNKDTEEVPATISPPEEDEKAVEESLAAPEPEKKSKKDKKDKKDKKAKKAKAEDDTTPVDEPKEPEEDTAPAQEAIAAEEEAPSTNGTPQKESKKRKRDDETKDDEPKQDEPMQAAPSNSDSLEAQADFISFGDLDDKPKLQERKRPKTEKEIERDERRKRAKTNYDDTFKKLRSALTARYEDPKTTEAPVDSFKNGSRKGGPLNKVKCVVRDIMQDPAVQSLSPKEAKHLKNRLRKEERKKRLLAANKKRKEARKQEKKSPYALKSKMTKLEQRIEKDKRKMEKLEQQVEKMKMASASAKAAKEPGPTDWRFGSLQSSVLSILPSIDSKQYDPCPRAFCRATCWVRGVWGVGTTGVRIGQSGRDPVPSSEDAIAQLLTGEDELISPGRMIQFASRRAGTPKKVTTSPVSIDTFIREAIRLPLEAIHKMTWPPEPTSEFEWDKIGFKITEVAGHVEAHYSRKEGKWTEPEWITDPYIKIHGLAPGMNYAFRQKDGQIRIFRPDQNANRMRHSASFICLPEPPVDLFLKCCHLAVAGNAAYVPPYGLGAGMYVRPLLFATGEQLGLNPPTDRYTLFVYVIPTGVYHGTHPIDALILDDFDRAAPQGTGSAKVGGNYAPVFKHAEKAKAQGYGITLHLDAKISVPGGRDGDMIIQWTYIEEFSTSGFIGMIHANEETGQKAKVVVPQSNSVISSVTVNSCMDIAKSFGWEVEFRPVSSTDLATAGHPVLYDELATFDEVVAAGTAAALVPIKSISQHSKNVKFEYLKGDEPGPMMQELIRVFKGIQQGNEPDTFDWCQLVTDPKAVTNGVGKH